MNPADLPIVGAPTNAGGHDFFGKVSRLGGKRLLCIGFSEAEITEYVVPHGPAEITMLTNWVDHIDAQVSKFRIVIGDITKQTSFEADSFDAILTLSVLEHLSDLPDSFREMTRLLVPGGEMLHMFGPAWSCAYGHHLYANANDPLLSFVAWSMPAHMHFLCTRDEIRKYYLDHGRDEDAVRTVFQWFYDTPLINRVFFDEYWKIISGPEFQVDQLELMYNELPKDHLRRLRLIHPGKADFSTYGGRFRLIVRK